MFAEERQKQLTAAVKTQATYIDYMKTILTRQHCCTLISGNDGHLDNQRLKSTEFELVHMIIRELEANYAQIDEILRECDVVLPTTEGRVDMAHTRDSDGEVVYTQQIVKVVQPFSLGDTDRSLWTAFNAYHKVKPDFEQLDVEDAENTCAIIFRDIITLGTGKKVSVRQRSVLRRIIEKNRIVFLWKFMSEGEGDFSGIHQDETGWCSLQPSSTSTEPATVLLLCNRRSPMQFSDFSSSGLSEEQKIDFDRLLQVSDEEAWGDIASELEKLLIKDALTDIGRKRRLAYHERQKLERKRLYQLVDEMSMELLRLEQAMPVGNWQMIAKQQLQARQDAENQHHRLQAAVRSQSQFIQKCSNVIQEALAERNIDRSTEYDDEISRNHKRIRLEPLDTDIYHEYLKELDHIYAQTDKIFESNRIDAASNDPNISAWKTNNDTGYFEFANKKSMPYNYLQAGQILWKLGLLLHNEEERQLYDEVEDPENTIALKFRMKTLLEPDGIASALQRIVGRRYIENNRVVVVWRSFTEGEGCFRGMHSEETGWCVIKDFSNERAMMNIFMRNIPMHFSMAEEKEAAVRQFTDLVCSSGSDDVFEMTDSLEKLSIINV
ncbi:hypothetical protein PHMEG_0004542 [Phytophthora megakarya]|uniref:M96 mating-specific protein n=1 Tax=Phytophthora megakarya TaxID=4795 RepID=A0A225WTK2_9STRA|nr:hypothetical protein PHMEG_0004542 [Phytophthora megakarya]